MVQPVKEGVNIAGDFLKEWFSNMYCFASVKLNNTLGSDLDGVDITAQPVIANLTTGVATFPQAVDVSAVNGFIVEHGKLTLANTATTPLAYVILVRGPGSAYAPGLPANDLLGAAFTQSELEARLAAMDPPVIVYDRGSELRDVQTT